MLQGTPQSLAPRTEYDEKLDVITGYVEKFACIAGRQVTPQLYAVYIEALEDLELRRIRGGMKQYLQRGKGWAWPGELREWIEEEV